MSSSPVTLMTWYPSGPIRLESSSCTGSNCTGSNCPRPTGLRPNNGRQPGHADDLVSVRPHPAGKLQLHRLELHRLELHRLERHWLERHRPAFGRLALDRLAPCGLEADKPPPPPGNPHFLTSDRK